MILDEASTKLSRTLCSVTAAVLFALAIVGPLNAQEQTPPPDWRESNAYTLGVQAYLYAFPWAYMPDARWTRTEAIERQADRFHHVRKLEDAEHLNGGAPNNDTLYSRAWVHLKDEPVILSVPPTPTRDWLFRAVQMLAGFVANDPIEAIYLNVSQDGDGRPLSGKNQYIICFEKGGQPNVKAFWSITMYNAPYNLVANPINRYSLGDRSGLKAGEDGSATIYVQKEAPGEEKEANWLPAPDGMFFLIMRTYLPGPDLVDQTWQPPKISRID